MTREEFYKSNRGEREYYNATEDEELMLPLTEDGFNALLEKAAAENNLVIDNQLRSLLAGYIHHIPSDEVSFNYQRLVRAFYKSVSNTMTYKIDQEAKNDEMKKLKALEPESNVTPIRET